jgi:hypothetical protein
LAIWGNGGLLNAPSPGVPPITGILIPQSLFDLVYDAGTNPGWEAWFRATHTWEADLGTAVASMSINPFSALEWDAPNRIENVAQFGAIIGDIISHAVYRFGDPAQPMANLASLNALTLEISNTILGLAVYNLTWDVIVGEMGTQFRITVQQVLQAAPPVPPVTPPVTPPTQPEIDAWLAMVGMLYENSFFAGDDFIDANVEAAIARFVFWHWYTVIARPALDAFNVAHYPGTPLTLAQFIWWLEYQYALQA